MSRNWAAGLAAVGTSIFLACGPTARFPAGEALLRGERPPETRVPDSLRADLELTAFQGSRKSTVSAALSLKPGSRYKLDVFGLPGMVEASFLWADTGWTLVIYGREGYLEGYGDTVDLPGLGVRDAPVHDLFAPLWGDFFPGDGAGSTGAAPGDSSIAAGTRGPGPLYPARPEPEGRDRLRYGGRDAAWWATLDPATGMVREAGRADSALRVAYEGWRLQGGRPVPKRVRLFAGTRPLLEIEVGKVEDNPAWKRDPFRVKIPKGFERLRTPGPR